MVDTGHYPLVQDRRGVVWDLLLYVPTVVVLSLLGLKVWYGGDQTWGYLLFFMASFFFIAGANRILKTRLMWLPKAAVAIDIAEGRVRLQLRDGSHTDLVKEVRYYADSHGKSFGLSGTDVLGKRLQHIFHRGQFADDSAFNSATAKLKIYQ